MEMRKILRNPYMLVSNNVPNNFTSQRLKSYTEGIKLASLLKLPFLSNNDTFHIKIRLLTRNTGGIKESNISFNNVGVSDNLTA